jgi:hypothetical protein
MTAYAPPTINYFSGLQFNPKINEVALSVFNTLYGGIINITGTIQANIVAPIIQMTASNYFKITSPLIYFSPLGTWSAFTCSQTLTSFYNPALVSFTSPEIKCTNGATDTLDLTETQTTFKNTSTVSFTQPIFIVRDALLELFLYFTTTGGAIINNPVGTLTLSSPTYTQTGTLANLNASTTNITGTACNLDSTTTTVSGATTNLNATTTSSTSTTVNATSATAVNLGSSSSTVTVGNVLKMNGFYFGNGSLTNTTGYYIQTGRSNTQTSIAAGSGVQYTFLFTTAFSTGTTPIVIAMANVLASPTTCRIATCVSVTQNIGFNVNMYNPTGSASGNYEVTYIAIGRL